MVDRWTLWRVDLGHAVGQWNACEMPAESVLGGRIEFVEVMPVAEHEHSSAAARAVIVADDRYNEALDQQIDVEEAFACFWDSVNLLRKAFNA